MKQPSLVPAVAVGEDHIEQKVEAECSEEEKCGDNPPELPLSDDQQRVEVQLEGGDDLQLDGEGGDDAGRGVDPGHGGHLQVGLQPSHQPQTLTTVDYTVYLSDHSLGIGHFSSPLSLLP